MSCPDLFARVDGWEPRTSSAMMALIPPDPTDAGGSAASASLRATGAPEM
jgi:hypothetical protein